jgi:hypothetical protein
MRFQKELPHPCRGEKAYRRQARSLFGYRVLLGGRQNLLLGVPGVLSESSSGRFMHDFEPPVPVGHSRRKERKENIFLKALERCAFKKSCLTPDGVTTNSAQVKTFWLLRFSWQKTKNL